MSFFARGLSFLLGRTTKPVRRHGTQDDGETTRTPLESEPATPNSWIAYRDAYGRPYWRNNLTGQWTYNLQHAQQSFPTQPAQGWPAPTLPGLHLAQAPWNEMVPVPSVPMFTVASYAEGERERGYWETVYDSVGEKCWRHTKTRKVTRSDPYY